MTFSIASSRDIPLTHITSSRQPILSERTLLASSASSTLTSSTTIQSLLPSSFIPTTILSISTKGKGFMSFPLSPSELEIPIFSPTTGRPVYISIRPKRHSGTCYLLDAEDETKQKLAWTEYTWGPLKWPKVKILGSGNENEEFEIKGIRPWSRRVGFSCHWGDFEWRYASRKEKDEGVNNLLVLEKVLDGGRRWKVAQLIRGEGTRSPGTNKRTAGNGGRLEVCERGEEGEVVCGMVVVLVTVLVMLKREVDRMRGMQMAAMSGGGGGC